MLKDESCNEWNSEWYNEKRQIQLGSNIAVKNIYDSVFATFVTIREEFFPNEDVYAFELFEKWLSLVIDVNTNSIGEKEQRQLMYGKKTKNGTRVRKNTKWQISHIRSLKRKGNDHKRYLIEDFTLG